MIIVHNLRPTASVTTVQKLDKIIANAIRFLPKPGEPIAILMPCTVIESNDLADTYGNPGTQTGVARDSGAHGPVRPGANGAAKNPLEQSLHFWL